ncbi:MAG: hypothetical protein L0H31_08070 [Nocardioidaceae bacterium]|nr:hypothetical protein [Nocardioidaceae bacterium]
MKGVRLRSGQVNCIRHQLVHVVPVVLKPAQKDIGVADFVVRRFVPNECANVAHQLREVRQVGRMCA